MNEKDEIIARKAFNGGTLPTPSNVSHRKKKPKFVFIINGKGASGKYAMIEGLESLGMSVLNVSSIDPVKDILFHLDCYDGKEKSDKTRKCLSDLKQVFDEYCDLSLNHVTKIFDSYRRFEFNFDCMFVHIREPYNIDLFKCYIEHCSYVKVQTILVTKPDVESKVFGNTSDDNVNDYEYDHVFSNNGSLEESQKMFYDYIHNLITN